MDTLEDGTKVYSGPWKEPRPDDPRHFVIVAPAEGKTLVYWGTPKVKDDLGGDRVATGVPRAQRDTGTQLQAHDRPWRAQYQLWPQEDCRSRPASATQRESNSSSRWRRPSSGSTRRPRRSRRNRTKVAESASKGHGKRLEQRQRALVVLATGVARTPSTNKPNWLSKSPALGPPGERADRDFRKQTIMTIRTLLLENALMAFMAALLGTLQTQGEFGHVSCTCSLSAAGLGWRRPPRSSIGSTPPAYRCRIDAC